MSPQVVATAVRKAGRWLATRHKNVSKHVSLHQSAAARHLTRPWLLSKAIHTVFRGANPKKLIERTLASPDRSMVQAARRAGRKGHVVIEKMFDRMIGRNGERILKVVIDQTTGRIVTAFPVREFTIAASGVFAVAFLDLISDAIEEVENTITTRLAAKQQAAENRTFGVKALEFIIDILIDPSVANENEDILIAIDQASARARVERLQALLSERIAAHLPPEVAATGRYTGKDRNGVIREFPITEISAAILHVPPDHAGSMEALGEIVSEAKDRAKREGPGRITEVHLAGS